MELSRAVEELHKLLKDAGEGMWQHLDFTIKIHNFALVFVLNQKLKVLVFILPIILVLQFAS